MMRSRRRGQAAIAAWQNRAALAKRVRMTRGLRLIILSLLMLCAGLATPARAEVVVSFSSHDFGYRFPPAFLVMTGTPDGQSEWLPDTYGFSPPLADPHS